MSRKKVKLQWIANDAARRATFKKRKKGLMKKVQELSILCNVKACAVVYGHHELQPEVWPSPEEAVAILRTFRGMPEHEQGRRRMDQESFLRQRTEKLREQIDKEKKAARELQVELLLSDCLKGVRKVEDLGMEETTSLGCLVEMKLKELQAQINRLRGKQHQLVAANSMGIPSQPPPLVVKPPSPPLVQHHQLANSYISSLPPWRPPHLLVEGGASHKQPDLHDDPATAASGMMPAQRNNLVGTAAEGDKRTDWIMDVMGPYSHLFYEGDCMAPPMMDDTKNLWLMDPFFPFN